ncbi:uncharacterized protein LOC128209453 isoform X2 [Mya arenaria]|uniref:uncharacterized protein LOC128209453 isoform X2 n=1 Tax=Mya arenaria TaxID=6604 RepID=UPI0022E9458C|nr:uncharacterized protein LOC128209453 isoform X2 [Mya arenaria]
MRQLTLFLIFIVCMKCSIGDNYSPVLLIDSCTKQTLQVSIHGASDHGVVYILGCADTCQHYTSAESGVYIFDLQANKINWERTFRVVIQGHADYQTGQDKQFPVTCIADTSDIAVANPVNLGPLRDETALNKTIKPTATMRLYKDGSSVGGQTVTLMDTLTMVLTLDDGFSEMFDIKARRCVADTFLIVSNFCATNTELFPMFTHSSQGELQSEFGAFRTTSLRGGAVKMTFSCTLQVCKGPCNPTYCMNGHPGYGRRSAVDHVMYNISVGSTITVLELNTDNHTIPLVIDDDDPTVELERTNATNIVITENASKHSNDCSCDLTIVLLVALIAAIILVGFVAFVRLIHSHKYGRFADKPTVISPAPLPVLRLRENLHYETEEEGDQYMYQEEDEDNWIGMDFNDPCSYDPRCNHHLFYPK